MSDRQTLTRAERLRTIGVIRRLFGEGESRFVYPFRIVWLPAQDTETAQASKTVSALETVRTTETAPATDQAQAAVQVGEIALPSATAQGAATAPAPATAGTGLRILFSVPKKYHKRANRRNLLRRRTKEAYRLQKSLLQLAKPYDIALIYTSREVESYDRIAHAVRKIIDHLNALGR